MDGADGILRSVLQHQTAVASYAFSGSAPTLMERLFEDPSRPLLEHAVSVELLPLPPGPTAAFLEERFRLTGRDVGNALDPLLAFADLLLRCGAIGKDALLALYHDSEQRLRRAAAEAATRRKLTTVAEITKPLARPQPGQCRVQVADPQTRAKVFRGKLPEEDSRPRHMAFRIPQALTDLLAAYPNAFLFGEDVAKKGGVYNATAGLYETFGPGRVFNTMLDEIEHTPEQRILNQHLMTVATWGPPLCAMLDYTHKDGRFVRYERLALPLSSDGATVDMLFGGIVFDAAYG